MVCRVSSAVSVVYDRATRDEHADTQTDASATGRQQPPRSQENKGTKPHQNSYATANLFFSKARGPAPGGSANRKPKPQRS
eukprot:1307525-Prymnesium_polylepis.1